jgi:probable phosphoglycerate mutase
VGVAIAGRQPGVRLNAAGQKEAAQLAHGLALCKIHRIFSSPLERAHETALPLAKALGLEIQFSDALIEIQFGEWTGKRIDELDADPQWQQWNSFRSGNRVPGGESMLEVQARFVGFMEQLRRRYPGDSIVLVSHGDPIRAALLYYLGMPLDSFGRLELSPASVSILEISDQGTRAIAVNQTCRGG